ncbi:MAG: twin-arginine translocation signal domain-containing protein, partial [Candidatus Omnitrophica bacterium]|nr:twin-arginine translocation signal domain-containing protein [Candidatus Omnitrophota bacterium]
MSSTSSTFSPASLPITRRHFLRGTAVTTAALSLSATSWSRAIGANERLR